MSRLRPVLAWAAGAASVLAYAPFEYFPLAAVALAVLYALLGRAADAAITPGARRRAGFLIGWAWGFGALGAGVSWLYVALHRFGGMPMPLAGSAIALFCAVMALFAGGAGALFADLRRGRPWADAALFGALWLLT
ncbi:MAG TPA: apolipoprotein N-acyltransferase, partial [Rhodocyclaceae bacterium]|nr:apolipoprotein N-acyltransferase [Rhodocyclaceae bacterium]